MTAGFALAGEPSVAGKDYLLSPAQRTAALTAARQRLAKEYRYSSVVRLHVVSASELEVYFRSEPFQEGYFSHLTLQLKKKGWVVTGEMPDVSWMFEH
jgi:hypothetical protein